MYATITIPAQIKYFDNRYELQWGKVSHATSASAGIDLRAALDAPLTLGPGQEALVGTGIAIFIDNPNFCGFIHPRSGMGTKGLVIGNLTGVIDADYQGELKLKLWNRSSTETFTIQPGDRVAQYVVTPVVHLNLAEVASFAKLTERGEGGFGSTGTE